MHGHAMPRTTAALALCLAACRVGAGQGGVVFRVGELRERPVGVAFADFNSVVYLPPAQLSRQLRSAMAATIEEHALDHPYTTAEIEPFDLVALDFGNGDERAFGLLREVLRVGHPTAGRFETVAPPLCLSEYEMRAERPAPALGADSESVLREAGLSESEIAAALDRSPQV